jgi:hypothetical protein
MQKWLRSEKMSSSTNFRARTTFGDSVWTSMRSATGKVQAGCRVRCPATSTRHIRQAPMGASAGWWQRVGMSMPAAWAARRILWPGWAETFCPFIVMVMVLIDPPPRGWEA